MTLKLTRPTPSLIVSFTALVVSLGSIAMAANTVFSTDIVDGQVMTADLGTSAVITPKLADEAVTSDKIGPGAVSSGKVLDNSLTGADILNGSLTGADVLDNSLSLADLRGADLKRNITLAANSIPNGRCVDFTIVVNGTHAGEVALVSSVGALPSGVLIYGARVPADNQLVLKVCNLTGGAFPALNSIPIHAVSFG